MALPEETQAAPGGGRCGWRPSLQTRLEARGEPAGAPALPVRPDRRSQNQPFLKRISSFPRRPVRAQLEAMTLSCEKRHPGPPQAAPRPGRPRPARIPPPPGAQFVLRPGLCHPLAFRTPRLVSAAPPSVLTVSRERRIPVEGATLTCRPREGPRYGDRGPEASVCPAARAWRAGEAAGLPAHGHPEPLLPGVWKLVHPDLPGAPATRSSLCGSRWSPCGRMPPPSGQHGAGQPPGPGRTFEQAQ